MSDIILNFVSQLDSGDVGRQLFTLHQLLGGAPPDPSTALELAVRLGTENTGGLPVAYVTLRRPPQTTPDAPLVDYFLHVGPQHVRAPQGGAFIWSTKLGLERRHDRLADLVHTRWGEYETVHVLAAAGDPKSVTIALPVSRIDSLERT